MNTTTNTAAITATAGEIVTAAEVDALLGSLRAIEGCREIADRPGDEATLRFAQVLLKVITTPAKTTAGEELKRWTRSRGLVDETCDQLKHIAFKRERLGYDTEAACLREVGVLLKKLLERALQQSGEDGAPMPVASATI